VDDDRDKPKTPEREQIGISGGWGATFVGIDAKHLKIDGHDATDDRVPHDKSWKTKAEEEADEAELEANEPDGA
jgi:hypothetical protein